MGIEKLKSDKLSKLKKIKLGKIGKSQVEVKIVSQGPIADVESDLVTEVGVGGFEIVEDEVDIDDSSDEISESMFSGDNSGNIKGAVNARLKERQATIADHHIQLRIPGRYGPMYKELTSPMKKALKDVYIEALVELFSGL